MPQQIRLPWITSIESRFSAGFAEHDVLVGLDYLHLDDGYKFASNVYGGQFDLYDPVYGQSVLDLIQRIDFRMKRRQFGLYAQDQMRWNNWIVTAGLRHDWIAADSTSNIAQPFSVDEGAVTGRLGLTYRFDSGFAPYIAYSTSFDPVDGISTTGGSLRPLEGKQIEAGVKYESPDGRTFVTLAAFHLDQKNSTAPNHDPAGKGLFQVGTAESAGCSSRGENGADQQP